LWMMNWEVLGKNSSMNKDFRVAFQVHSTVFSPNGSCVWQSHCICVPNALGSAPGESKMYFYACLFPSLIPNKGKTLWSPLLAVIIILPLQVAVQSAP
jgi:hypothetical protein